VAVRERSELGSGSIRTDQHKLKQMHSPVELVAVTDAADGDEKLIRHGIAIFSFGPSNAA
jgi:hypothetical protein